MMFCTQEPTYQYFTADFEFLEGKSYVFIDFTSSWLGTASDALQTSFFEWNEARQSIPLALLILGGRCEPQSWALAHI